jgi:protocatechuate 3,4-dioxygenase beta subunit
MSAFDSLSMARGLDRVVTPRQPRGPFYPLELPLDDDNDLISVRGQAGTAKGEITNIIGMLMDEHGRPVPNMRIEIWQVNAFGRYHHPRDQQNKPFDANFQGHGHTVSGDDGGYRFRTIKPVAYPGRAPHIHFSISGANVEPLTTQMYVAGAPENERDFLLNRIRDRQLRQQLIVDLTPYVVDQRAELIGRFDIVLAADGRFG